ncbi:phospholipase D-like domain-containing protein [Sphingomonas bacterium]|uniref:phospholipase D-like domain-containing protein n=1 Tax=Sphingomonas bacterium TaxID=1895847 RepID=UPI001575FEBF|nr:phospholipase D-like domain-containing protein [Sphingomonas bacterium]
MTLPDPRTAWYAAEWIIRIGALAVVPLRRSPAATASWLLLIFFLPVPGLVLFLMIGRPHFPVWRQQRSKALHPYFADIAARIEADAPPGECSEIGGFAHRLGRLPACGGNMVELIDDYDGMIDRLVGDIDGAAERVDILVYIFANDMVGRRIAAALGRARSRGVAVRVMFDPVGSHHWRRGTLKLLRGVDVDVREALPVRWLWRRTRSDMRNHRKLFVIDGRVGYAGSQNLVAKDFRPGVVNRELVARVTGPAVASLMAVVAGDWSLETEDRPDAVKIPDAVGHARVQLLPSGADYPLEGFETLLVWQLHRACDRVVLVTPYFIPDEAVLAAMRSAAARGVTVDLIVSAVVDQHIVHLAQCSYYDALLSAGIRIHLFRDFLLHAKNVSVDSRLGIVGSSNVDLRSFQLNEEASLLLYDSDTIGGLERIQEAYLDGSDCVDLMTWRARPKVRRLIENIARIMSPLL